MSDYDLVDDTMTMLDNAEVINKFTDTVWVRLDRHAWDEYVKSTGVENASQCLYATKE